ncbi:MAG TPA: branched-chain amino acid aminotransferase [candidate division Zixibacteria bacterium]|nr:branched-chain amino acid aminotransferase [candidate division Zixibacteria bacterium]
MDISVLPLDESTVRIPDNGELGFGRIMANRMFSQWFTPETGWHEAKIGPYEKICLDPATAVFHYGQEIFEGAKAYRRPDGNINLFRTWENMARFNESARRLAMPTVDEEDHLAAIVQLISLEHQWVPDKPGASLYIRPTMIATDAALGVHRSTCYMHYVILSPVDFYFKEGFSPIPVYITHKYHRAVKGGTGNVKAGGNYAASLLVAEKARQIGYSQVLWLDAIESRYIEEVGAMNICFVYEGKRVVTPPLTGSILPGVTRDSVLTLAKDLGYEVAEERIDVDEMLADVESGRITEVFGCGTAAIIAPVGRFRYRDRDYSVNNNELGPVSSLIYKELTDIQFGRIPDRFGWTYTIEVNSN